MTLDMDVAEWLHAMADAHYGGDVQLALNECLRALLVAEQAKPFDPWATVSHLARSRAPGRR